MSTNHLVHGHEALAQCPRCQLNLLAVCRYLNTHIGPRYASLCITRPDLGWYDSESYGIAYKVRGYCKDHSNPEIFDLVSVTGDILRSHIHHNYFGHYSYGHQGGDFSFNEVRN